VIKNNQILIIGGGLAGLITAIHLSKIGFKIIVVEKNSFPKHKVCGEYISNEVLPYFDWLDINIKELNPSQISNLEFSTLKGKKVKVQLPLGGFGISRYALDAFLYKKMIANGCEFIQDSVENINYNNEEFTVTTSNNSILKSKWVIGAFGKRSNIDHKLDRNLDTEKSSWLAIKAHYKGNFKSSLVGLHNFKGGYCGISEVENNQINVCYLADYRSFKKYKNIDEYQEKILSLNPNLKAFFESSSMIFEKPITISQISFEKKKAIENHVLMVGDAAGLIHPLCGNGMAMAIHSAKILSDLIEDYSNNKLTTREALEKKYQYYWNKNFRKRMKTGRFIATLLQKQKLSEILIHIITIFPFLLFMIIKKTHGKPIINRY
jgi:menaquinone-9 beta-reductase